VISRTARAMAFSVKGVEDKFRMPRNINDHVLLETARAFLVDALKFVDDFKQRELPADFFEELDSNIKLFEKAISEQNQGLETRAGSNAAIDDAIERGMNTVRELDAIVRNKYSEDPYMLMAWETARHVERARRSNGDPATDPTQPAVS
jgi:hypothetical protein